jgi:hypothetical protein
MTAEKVDTSSFRQMRLSAERYPHFSGSFHCGHSAAATKGSFYICGSWFLTSSLNLLRLSVPIPSFLRERHPRNFDFNRGTGDSARSPSSFTKKPAQRDSPITVSMDGPLVPQTYRCYTVWLGHSLYAFDTHQAGLHQNQMPIARPPLT